MRRRTPCLRLQKTTYIAQVRRPFATGADTCLCMCLPCELCAVIMARYCAVLLFMHANFELFITSHAQSVGEWRFAGEQALSYTQRHMSAVQKAPTMSAALCPGPCRKAHAAALATALPSNALSVRPLREPRARGHAGTARNVTPFEEAKRVTYIPPDMTPFSTFAASPIMGRRKQG